MSSKTKQQKPKWFKGSVYTKGGQVSIDDESEEDIKVSFTYELKEAPATYKYEDEAAEKAEFEQVIGNILYDIVVNTDKVKEVDGTDNTKQSD